MSYHELHCTSHFSFLRGASSCEELFVTAAELGLPVLGITDHNSVAGLVRAHEAAKVTGVRAVLGCRIDLQDANPLLLYPEDKRGWQQLCRLLTIGKRRGGKGNCVLRWEDVAEHKAGLRAVLLCDNADETMARDLERLARTFEECGYLALTRRFGPNETARLDRAESAARKVGVKTLATNDVLYHTESRRILQDVVTAIREGCTVDDLGKRRERSAGRWLKPAAEMERLFSRHPEAVAHTQELAEACSFHLEELSYQYPDEISPEGEPAQEWLARLVRERLPSRYPEGTPTSVEKLIAHELSLIEELAYAPYFLTVYRIVEAANRMGILCQGRGSAANSAVCYVLGITSIEPESGGLLFERFVSRERGEPPDIDVDFEHERREEVIQWIYNEYGRDRAALTATVVRYRGRGAIREVGKALGVPEDVTGALAKLTWMWDENGVTEREAKELNLNLHDRRLRLVMHLAKELMGTPRHLSQHPGGFVLTSAPLLDLVPIEPAAMENRQVIEWDKDDIDILRFMKVDVLGLGMLGCLRRFFDLLEEHKGQRLALHTVPADDKATYDMICRADTLGVFQIESRAQMSMLPRMRPRSLDDLTVEVAIVRPGPIQGQMVHPYLKRREGLEPAEYPTPEFKEVLGKTLGIPLFQEQAMAIAMKCGGFSAGEADELRRAMATFKMTGGVSTFRERLIEGMMNHGLTREFAERTFSQLEGFGSYGFPMSHAASFAKIAYVSSWAKCHHPDIFCASLLNAQPMGFYAPAQIVWCARNHGVDVRPVDVNHSRWDCILEPPRKEGEFFAVRLGFRMISGMREHDAALIVGARNEPYESPRDLQSRTGLAGSSIMRLVEGDAFGSCALGRRDAGWKVAALKDTPLPLFEAADRRDLQLTAENTEEYFTLPAMTESREVVEDYVSLGLSLKAHPLRFLRQTLRRKGCVTADEAYGYRERTVVRIAGIVLSRQRPGSAKGVMFLTLEDETGPANIIVWPSLFETYRRVVLSAGMIGVEGEIQREGQVQHIIAKRLIDLTPALRKLGEREDDVPLPYGRGDE
ncbi:MAG: error-prone DNA polymerase, partial [Parvularcula sp.]|nr:error-prone DNA polymerase [Parvularcula sp.]